MKNLFIGIDFSKEKVDVTIISANGLAETAGRVYGEFLTTTSGYNKLIKWVEKNSNGYEVSSWLFCGENTGGYSKGLSNYLYAKGYDMWLENAQNIKNASGLRRLKSDRADSAMIAEYAMRNYDRAVMYEPLDDSLSQLRELFLYRHKLVSIKAQLTVRRSEKKLTMEKSPVKTMMSQCGKHLITEVCKSIDKLDEKIQSIIEANDDLSRVYNIVTSVPGIGTQNAVCLMVYTDNFKRFEYNPRKIACYYGIAPFGKDSGTSVHSDPRVHCMANRLIKAILTQAALAAVHYCPVITNYYTRLIARGKKKPVALNNVKNKLIHIATAMVRNGRGYDPEYVTQSILNAV